MFSLWRLPAWSMRPGLAACRALCTSDESRAELQRFLQAASRPKMGQGKAKQSAGQRALDLVKHAKVFEDIDVAALLRLKSPDLKKLNIGCQDRKRLLRYIAKANAGYTIEGSAHWRNWRETRE